MIPDLQSSLDEGYLRAVEHLLRSLETKTLTGARTLPPSVHWQKRPCDHCSTQMTFITAHSGGGLVEVVRYR